MVPKTPETIDRSKSVTKAWRTVVERRLAVPAGPALLLVVLGLVWLAIAPAEQLAAQPAEQLAAQPAEQLAAQAAERPTGLQAAIALEQLLIDSIQRAERSVVAIARVRQPVNDGEDPAALGPLAVPQLFAEGDSPAHPDFVPNEFGTGVAIDRDGLVLTTAHLLGDFQSSDYYVWFRHRPFKATVLAVDSWFDLAVLKIDSNDLVPVTFGDGKKTRKGQIVVALGNPFSIARDGEVSASWGIISNLQRRAPRVRRAAPNSPGRDTLHHYGTLIQTDARLNIGYSGGALINLQGKMIGLTTSYAATAGVTPAAGFAIPVDEDFLRVVETLKQGRKPEYGFLGVKAELLSEDIRRQGQQGALVGQVLIGTPAERAGLRAGDLITHIDGRSVFVDDDMIRLIASRSPEMTAILSVSRGFQSGRPVAPTKIPAVLTKRYLSPDDGQFGTAPEPTWRGMRVDYSTASPGFAFLGSAFDAANCVYVAAVAKESTAWNAGIRVGDYVTRVEGEKVDTPNRFRSLLADLDADVVLEVLTGQGTTQIRTISP